MLERLTTIVRRYAAAVVLAWIAAAAAVTLLAPGIQQVGTLDEAALLPADTPARRANTALAERFPDDLGRNVAVIVATRPGGLTPEDRQALRGLAHDIAAGAVDIGAVRVRSAADDPLTASVLTTPETELVLVELPGSPFEETTARAVETLRAELGRVTPAGLEVHVTGLAGIARDEVRAVLTSVDRTTVITVVLIVLILAFVYRAPIAAGVPLVTIGVAFLVARGLVALLAQSGWQVASHVETFMVVLVFGAGTDYTLFLVSRYREEAAAARRSVALARTLLVMSGVLLAAAATVIVAFLSMGTAHFGLYRSSGPAIALAIAVTLVASLTLTPALLRLAGRWAFWPHRSGGGVHGAWGQAGWERLARTVRRWPAEVLLLGTIVLLLMASGLGWLQQSFDLLRDLPRDADSRQGFDVLREHYPPGLLAPLHVLVVSDRPVRDAEVFAAVDALTDRLRDDPMVGTVRSVTQPLGEPLTLDGLGELLGTDTAGGLDPEALRAFGLDPNQVDIGPLLTALTSPGGLRFTPELLDRYPVLADRITPSFLGHDGRSLRLTIELARDPFAPEALTFIRQLGDRIAEELAGSALAGADVLVGGPAAFEADVEAVASRDLGVITAVLVVGTLLVLVALVRAVVAPLYLLATVLLSFAATLGATVLVSRGLFGLDTMSFWVAPFLLVILVALGADYNIFITSRIREEVDAGWPVRDAATRGLVLTGGVITSAGLILAGTFAALLAVPLPNLRQLGFAVTLGVLLDTFVVRSVLVPAATVLLGERAFWPPIPASAPRRLRWAPAGGAAVGLVVLLLVASQLPGIGGGAVEVPVAAGSGPGAAAGPGVPSPGPTGASPVPGATAPTSTPETGAPTASPRATPGGTAGGSPTSPAASGPPPTTAPPTSSPTGGPTPTATTPADRIAVPRTGSWRYHTTGTRRIGAAGSPQPFDEEATTEVSRVGGSDDAPHIRLYSQSSSGTAEDIRRYQPTMVELLETRQSAGLVQSGGVVDPPAVILRWPLAVGDRWTHQGTVGGDTSTSSTFAVTGTDEVEVAGHRYRCWIVEQHTTLSGATEGTTDAQLCWSVELGMIVWAIRDAQGTSSGVPFEFHSESRLVGIP